MSENLAETLRRTTVGSEKAAKSVAAPNAAGLTSRRDTVDQFIGQALVIAFAMIVGNKFVKGPADVPFPQRNHLVETFVLDRPRNRRPCSCAFSTRFSSRRYSMTSCCPRSSQPTRAARISCKGATG